MELPLAPIERIMRDAGAERISPDAVVALSNMLKKRAEEVTEGKPLPLTIYSSPGNPRAK